MAVLISLGIPKNTAEEIIRSALDSDTDLKNAGKALDGGSGSQKHQGKIPSGDPEKTLGRWLEWKQLGYDSAK